MAVDGYAVSNSLGRFLLSISRDIKMCTPNVLTVVSLCPCIQLTLTFLNSLLLWRLWHGDRSLLQHPHGAFEA